MSPQSWDGHTERRKNPSRITEELRASNEELKNNIERLKAHIISEFGGEDPFTGLQTEGNVNRNLRDLSKLIADLTMSIERQNIRIQKLENWRWLILGGGAVILFIIKLTVKG